MAVDVRTASQELVAQVRGDEFERQVALALPETVSPRRFARIAVTAIQQNPDLAKCQRDSVFQALLRCAADGLLPDGREAALVRFGDNAAYLPMIGGFRKIAADHGWTLRTRVVHENDVFDYSEEPATLAHTPPRPGIERGPLVACYAIATHADGRRLQRVMSADDVAKRKAVARSKNVWEQWPEPMWEKTVGRDLFNELPLGDLDHERIQSMIAAEQAVEHAAADPVAALYGRTDDSPVPPGDAATGPNMRADHDTDVNGGSSDRGGDGASGRVAEAAAAAEPEPEDGVWEPVDDVGPTDEEVANAGTLIVPGGIHQGKTIGQVAELGEQGEQWLLTQLKKLADTAPAKPAIATFVRGRLPELWARYERWLETQERS